MRPLAPVAAALLGVAAFPVAARAQGVGREVEVRFGRWYNANDATLYAVRATSPLAGQVSQSFVADAAINDRLGRRRAFYGAGYELQFFRGHAALSPYGVTGVALGLSTDTTVQALAAAWSAGLGLEWRPFGGVALGTEARYRVEARGPRGFWRPGADARRGWALSLGLSIGLGGGGNLMSSAGRNPPEPPAHVTGSAADVVETAIGELGTPYHWGGTAENGFDCSGLIQYAYAQHGIRLPRTSTEQAHAGMEIDRTLGALKPGDILVFSGTPGGPITHVGMYVGERKFIHSSSTGVRISELDPSDPEGKYWLPRWIGARRILP